MRPLRAADRSLDLDPGSPSSVASSASDADHPSCDHRGPRGADDGGRPSANHRVERGPSFWTERRPYPQVCEGSAADRDSIASWDLICSRCLGADGNLANEWDVQRGAASSLWCADGGTFTILPHGHVTVLKKTSIWSCVGSSDQSRQRKAAPQSKPLARSSCTTSKFWCKP